MTLDDAKLQIVNLTNSKFTQDVAYHLALLLHCTYPDHACFVHELQREDIGGQALARVGFARTHLHQLLMRRPLSAVDATTRSTAAT